MAPQPMMAANQTSPRKGGAFEMGASEVEPVKLSHVPGKDSFWKSEVRVGE